jgi:hypothetical protein
VRTATPVPLDPSKPYQAFCRDFDLEVEAEKVDAVLGLARNSTSERFAERIRSTTSQNVLEDTVVSLLVFGNDIYSERHAGFCLPTRDPRGTDWRFEELRGFDHFQLVFESQNELSADHVHD